MSKYTVAERAFVKSIVGTLSIKRISDLEIVNEVFNQTNKTLSKSGLHNVRQSIKRESYKWYKTMREGEYEYIHEFKERINEILFLQKKHHEIVENNSTNPQIQQTSLAELHRLSITLSNLFDVAPTIINDITIPAAPQSKSSNNSNHRKRVYRLVSILKYYKNHSGYGTRRNTLSWQKKVMDSAAGIIL